MSGAVRRWLSPGYLWRRTLHNLPQKLLALLLSLLLWLVAPAERRSNVEVGFNVPLEVRDTTGAGSLRTTSGLPATVRVTLGGPRSRLQGLSAGEIEAAVDTTGAPEGSFSLPVEVRPPDGTRAVRVLPVRVQGFVDVQLSRSYPVVLSVGTPAGGGGADTGADAQRSLPRYLLSPQQVQVRGPSRLVGTVSRVITVPVSLRPGAEGQVGVLALSRSGQPLVGVSISPASVTVRRIDAGRLPIKTLPVVLPPVPLNLTLRAVKVLPPTVEVVAAPALLSALTQVTAQVNYREGQYVQTAVLQLPAGAQAIETVQVRLDLRRRAGGRTQPPGTQKSGAQKSGAQKSGTQAPGTQAPEIQAPDVEAP